MASTPLGDARGFARGATPPSVSITRVGLALASLAVVGAVGYQVAFHNRTLPGLTASGAPIGGLTADQLGARLSPEAQRVADATVTLRFGESERRLSAAELGLTYDLPATIEYALGVGRPGGETGLLGLPNAVAQQVKAPAQGYAIPAVLRLDEVKLERAISAFATTVDRPAVSARLAVSPDGELSVAAAQTSRTVDRGAAQNQLRDALLSLSALDAPVVLPGSEDRPLQLEADIADSRAVAQRILDQPLTLVGGDSRWTLDRSELARLLVLPEYEVDEPHLSVAGLRGWLPGVAAQWDVAAKPAQYGIRGGRLVVVAPPVEGHALDVNATADAIAEAAGKRAEIGVIAMRSNAGAVDPAKLRDAQRSVERLLGTPLILRQDEKQWPIEPAALAGMIRLESDTPNGPAYRPVLDRDALEAYLANATAQIGRPAADAAFRYRGGQVVLERPEQDGLRLDVGATVDTVMAQAFTERRIVDVVATRTKPSLTAAALSSIDVSDRLATGTTSYAGGIAARTWNVELAAQRLNGYMIPPGAVFSFNEAVGPTTLQADFRIAYGIAGTAGGGVQTVPSEAGGICQVATTLFHAAFRAGLPMVERNWHLYWIPRYGVGPSGVTGLDATVDDPGVDLRFRNNTGNWLAIQSRLDRNSQQIYFDLLGVDDGRQVAVGRPVITNVVAASQEPVYQNDPTMPAGQTLMVEHAEDGFRAAIGRTVKAKDGTVISEETFTSVYRPSRNVYFVGTR